MHQATDQGDVEPLSRRASRALPLIAAALTVMVVSGLICTSSVFGLAMTSDGGLH